MKCDIIAAGVGGQGVLSVSAIIAASALRAGLHAVQSEVHGMSQRGGAVVAHLRISDEPIHSATVGLGRADIIISMEPLESLRYLNWLAPTGMLLTSEEPVKNFANYPDMDELLSTIRAMPRTLLIDAVRLARDAGSPKAANMVMVGAAAHLLPISTDHILSFIEETFRAKGEKMVAINFKAFESGRAASQPATVERAVEVVTS